MSHKTKLYIDGKWVDPAVPDRWIKVIDPATEQEVAQVAAGSEADIDAAVKAAHRAFPAYSQTTREERLALLEGLLAAYKRLLPEISAAMTTEVGIPKSFCEQVQAHIGQRHLETAIEVLKEYPFELEWGHQGTTRIVREPVGVCGLISPWNWPMNQVLVKVAPALAAGCTMALKPSQYCPLSSLLIAEAAEEAGVPAGVFNLVNGPGSTLGAALAGHPLVDMVSVTGSTEVGASVAKAAAGTVKRVSQELGGKSAYIVFEDVDLEKVIGGGVKGCMRNSGQSCNAPTRMLVERSVYEQAVEIAARCGRRAQGGRPQRQRDFSWPCGREEAVRDRAGLHRVGPEGGRAPGGRGTGAALGAGPRLLHQAYRLRGRQ